MSKVGLLLTGGGARAAYQAGVLRAISEIGGFEENPFNIISGVSAGAVNGVWLCTQDQSFDKTTKLLWDAWASVKMKQVFKTDPMTFFEIASHWIRDFSFKNRFNRSKFTGILDSRPMIKFINKNFDFKAIKKNIQSGKIHGVAVTATSYNSGSSVVFFDGHPSISLWDKEWCKARRVHLELNHILASTSIPIFFPPIKIADEFYGDGGIKLASPLSPIIHMGADKILAIGIQHKNETNAKSILERNKISIGDILGTLLNALFFHSIEIDIERFNRINRTLSIMTEEQLEQEPDKLRSIPLLAIQPSEDLGQIECDLYSQFPNTLKFLLHALGASGIESRDLMSYLAFEKEYVQKILDLGFKDGMAHSEEIKKFFDLKTK